VSAFITKRRGSVLSLAGELIAPFVVVVAHEIMSQIRDIIRRTAAFKVQNCLIRLCGESQATVVRLSGVPGVGRGKAFR
jgi:hypothetical protein